MAGRLRGGRKKWLRKAKSAIDNLEVFRSQTKKPLGNRFRKGRESQRRSSESPSQGPQQSEKATPTPAHIHNAEKGYRAAQMRQQLLKLTSLDLAEEARRVTASEKLTDKEVERVFKLFVLSEHSSLDSRERGELIELILKENQ